VNKEHWTREQCGAYVSGCWAAQEKGCTLFRNPYVRGEPGYEEWREGFLSYVKSVGDNRPFLQRLADRFA